MRFQRLRSRLIVAFLGVALLAMLPLTIIPYVLLSKSQADIRTDSLHKVSVWLEQDVRMYQSVLENKFLLPAHRYFQKKIDQPDSSPWQNNNLWSDFADILQHPENYSEYDVKTRLASCVQRYYIEGSISIEKRGLPTIEFSLLTRPAYESMKPWMDRQFFYEDEEKNTLSLWSLMPLTHQTGSDSPETIGYLFLKSPFIQKFENKPPETDLKKNFNNVTLTVLSPNPFDLQGRIPDEAYEDLLDVNRDGGIRGVSLPSVDPSFLSSDNPSAEPQESLPVQALFLPFLNQNGQTAAIVVLYCPIVDLWQMIGINTVVSFLATLAFIILAAMLVARSIVNPIFRLSSAADQLSNGDFDVRVPVAGSTEQQILSSTFNQMAERIQTQLEQLHQKTLELEDSNRELAQTQTFLQNILANISTGVMSLDREGRINHANQVGCEILHLPPCTGRSIEEVISSEPFRHILRQSFQNRMSFFQREIACTLPGGETLPLQVSTVPLLEANEFKGLVVTFHDLSAIRRLEEQVRRQERLAALGSMVAGVAHEIRNPLGIIRGSAELLKKRFGHLPEEAGLSEFIIDEVNRLSRVVNEFLMFARPPVPSLEEVSVDELVDTVLSYARNQQGSESYTYIKEIPDAIATVAVDTNLIKQVFLNLFLNAQEAMPDGGTVTVRARGCSRQEVAIEVIDQGTGIEPDRLQRIFDPFYTSKDSGTGLGLSLVHQIVSSHNGKIEVDSTPGQGSTFRVVFPTHGSTVKEQNTPAVL